LGGQGARWATYIPNKKRPASRPGIQDQSSLQPNSVELTGNV
jgi:hypothetical protein